MHLDRRKAEFGGARLLRAVEQHVEVSEHDALTEIGECESQLRTGRYHEAGEGSPGPSQ